MFKYFLIFISLTIFNTSVIAEQVFVCNTKKHTVVVNSLSDKDFSYTAWDKPNSMKSEPNIVIANGTEDVEGTGPCRHIVWRFTNKSVEYVVEKGLGCTESEPPKNAIGSLSVYENGDHKATWWCLK
jgi:hypothetical protein